jgi:prepilin-type N-terminal cleavage/methylation domain-containing protein
VTRLRRQDGFTLVEVTVAAALLLVGVLGVLTMLDGANKASSRTKAREAGINLAREAIEAARAVPFPDLVATRIDGELRAQPGLADSSAAAGWNVERRDILFTLVPSVCSVDDGTVAADGFGDHSAGGFCPDSGSTGTIDKNPLDYKRVAIDVTWKDGAQTRTARQQGIISNPGSAFAPAVKTLVANPAGPTITNAAVPSVAFTATTSIAADDLRWSLDGVTKGSATPSAGRTSWTFNWPIGPTVLDGTYEVGAEAFDEFGQSGVSRTLTLQLNRYLPKTPTGFVGGLNPRWGPEFAEFEWIPNPERDILGYRVKRVAGPIPSASDPVMCERTVEQPTNCDTAIPGSLPPNQRFYVVAYAPEAGSAGTEESAVPTLPDTRTVGGATPPGMPTNVTAVRGAEGTTLSWTPPADMDVRYYRVYRDDNSSWTERYDRTGSATDNAITDTKAGPGSRRYWLTAVDGDLAESPMAPPGGIAP